MQVLLETGRLVLRRFSNDDAGNLFDLDGDPDAMRYLSGGTATPRQVGLAPGCAKQPGVEAVPPRVRAP